MRRLASALLLGLAACSSSPTYYPERQEQVVLLQIWDAQRGSIAWEGLQELRIAIDTTSEEPVTLRELLERTAHDLVARLP